MMDVIVSFMLYDNSLCGDILLGICTSVSLEGTISCVLFRITMRAWFLFDGDEIRTDRVMSLSESQMVNITLTNW